MDVAKMFADFGVAGLLIVAVGVLYRDGKATAKEMNDRFIVGMKDMQSSFNEALKQQRADSVMMIHDIEESHSKQIELIKGK